MSALDYTIIALKNIRKRKLRVFLTLLGILIAIATIFVLISVSLGLEEAIEEQFRLFGTDKFFVQPRGQIAGPGTGGAVQLTKEDLNVIEKIPGVKLASPWTISPAKIELSDEIRYTSIVGIDLETSDLFAETSAYVAEEGRLLDKGDEGNIMIGSQYKHNNFLGKEVKLGDKILINEKEEFKVKGILKTVGNPSDDRLIYMPYENFRPLFNIPERIDTIVVQVEEESQIIEIADRVERKLQNSRNVNDKTQDFSILTPDEVLETFGQVLNIITAFLLGIAGISLLVGGIGIANTMYTSVLERTREIGVMKAIGAQNKDILIIFLTESGILGIVGGILGISLGFAIAQLIEYIAVEQLATTILQTSTPAWLFISSLTFSFLVGALSGLWPAYQATKTKPVEALRYE